MWILWILGICLSMGVIYEGVMVLIVMWGWSFFSSVKSGCVINVLLI